MRTETRTREEKYNVYVANDGTEFDNVAECELYEAREIFKEYDNLPCVTFSLSDIYEDGGDFTYYKIFFVRNARDMDIINAYLRKESTYTDYLTEEHIGQSVFICESDSNVCLADGYTIEAMKDEIVSSLDNYIYKVKAMEKKYLN